MKAAPSGVSSVAGALTLRGPRLRPAAKGLRPCVGWGGGVALAALTLVGGWGDGGNLPGS